MGGPLVASWGEKMSRDTQEEKFYDYFLTRIGSARVKSRKATLRDWNYPRLGRMQER